VRRLIKTGIACALGGTGADGLIRSLAVARNMPLVICYHRVVQDVRAYGNSIPAMMTSRQTLERQLDWVESRFRIISLDELGARLEGREQFDEPLAAITFDDGYSDIYYNAFPLLRRRGIPAAVFVVTDLISTSEIQLHDKLYLLLARAFSQSSSAAHELFQFLLQHGVRLPALQSLKNGHSDPLAATKMLLSSLPQARIRDVIQMLETRIEIAENALEGLQPLTWEMLMEMNQEGMIIGSHTKSHTLLTNESLQKVINEVVGSRQELGRRLGIKVNHFAYPDGRFNAATVRAVAAAYRYAYTTCRHQDTDYPLSTIPRRHFWENSSLDALGRFSPAIMSCQVNGIFDWMGSCRQDHDLNARRSQPQRWLSYEASEDF